jgi:arylsulfatase A-like enzyme
MFLENLHKLGLEDDTALIFTSDHGTELADLSGLGKRESQLHPFTTKLNLLLRHPEKSLNNIDFENLVHNQDIAPTILELAGMEEKSFEMDGTSLLRIVNDDNYDQDEFVITGWNDYASVRDYEWNYITNWISDEPRPELYDLNSDRDEAHNVCDLNPDIASKFKSRLENHLGGRLPRPQDQIRSDGASGMEYKPLYSTSYAPLFYKARMRWNDPGALPK